MVVRASHTASIEYAQKRSRVANNQRIRCVIINIFWILCPHHLCDLCVSVCMRYRWALLMFDEFSGEQKTRDYLFVDGECCHWLALSLSLYALSIIIIIINEFWVLIFWCAHSSMIMPSLYTDNDNTLLFVYQTFISGTRKDADAEEFALCVFLLLRWTFSLIEKKNNIRNLILDILPHTHIHTHPHVHTHVHIRTLTTLRDNVI